MRHAHFDSTFWTQQLTKDDDCSARLDAVGESNADQLESGPEMTEKRWGDGSKNPAKVREISIFLETLCCGPEKAVFSCASNVRTYLRCLFNEERPKAQFEVPTPKTRFDELMPRVLVLILSILHWLAKLKTFLPTYGFRWLVSSL